MNRLLKIGFDAVGYFELSPSEDNIQFNLSAHHNSKNLLYAFSSNGTVLYIGKTINSLKGRMGGYKNPGPSQTTNIEVNKKIKQLLENGDSLDIFALVDNGLLKYGDFHINLAAGLEDALIKEIQPGWNSLGVKKTVRNAIDNLEDSSETEGTISYDTTTEGLLASFETTLGVAQYNQGFINVPARFSELMGSDNSMLFVTLGNSGVILEGTINRRAVKNKAPRLMVGVDLKNWIQDNFNFKDTMKVEILSPTSIKVSKP